MYQIGIPEVRKYCSPLQASFWLAENKELKIDDLKDYSFKHLIDKAWKDKYTLILEFSENEKQIIIEGIKDKVIRSQYQTYFKNYDQDTARAIIYDYKNRNIFNYRSKRIIKKAINLQNTKGGWKNLNVLVDRLNSPELITRISK